ncbi:hypothetical protein HNR60_001607 [Rhodopseudomonas rhenobacensis]|uniref:VRR-NUC domain-containing protein n=1 Tax=Rhodopseudomonas rhenobacensis TaxID=87461 RepID=A0A7W7Z2V8_9BRAD|nr:VRR-NUC domain-containing protein [Rhodopseudomonas rhenobacensis]MBB5046858.1 hypothetical protein [Rhodopseudomonas rhenobacensis]
MALRLKSLAHLKRRAPLLRVPALRLQVAGAPKRKRASPEHDAQVRLFDEYLWPLLHADAVAYAIPNGGYRAKREAERLRDEGVTPGVPDIYILWRGRSYYIEMKSQAGREKSHQRVMREGLTLAGATCAVCRGLDAAVAQLRTWGLLREPEPADRWRTAA